MTNPHPIGIPELPLAPGALAAAGGAGGIVFRGIREDRELCFNFHIWKVTRTTS
jgi:hypothetical protein